MKKNLLTLLFLVVLCAGFSGTVYSVPPPTITPSGSITPFTTTQGTASASQNFSVSGGDLLADIIITPNTPLLGIEISTDGITFSDTLILPQSGGIVNPTTIYVRISSTALAGLISGTLDMTSSGAGPVSIPVSGTVGTGSPLISTIGSLSSFITTQGTASTAQSFTAGGSDLSNDITITPPTGIELSSDGGATYGNSVILTQSGGTVNPIDIYVRISTTALTGPISGNIDLNSTSASTVSVPVSGTVNSATTPLISPSGSLTPFNTTQGTVSGMQVFTVSGTDLIDDITVTPPAGMEVSPDGSTFSPSMVITQSAGSVSGAPVFIRISNTAVAGTINGTVDLTSSGAVTATVSVNGTVDPLIPTVNTNGTLSPFSTTQGTPSPYQTFDVVGINLTNDLTINSPGDIEMSIDFGTTYSSTVVLTPSGGTVGPKSVYVRVAATALTGAIGGNIDATSPGATLQSVPYSGNVNPGSSPVISPSGSLSPFTTNEGIASLPQTFDVSGTGLTNDITITAPADIELSSDGGSTYSPSLVLTQSGGFVNITTISVRIAATALSGTINGNIDMNSTGATTASVSVFGTVNPAIVTSPPVITVTGSLSPFTTTEGIPSSSQTFDVSGTDLIDDITVIAPSGMEVSNDGGTLYGPTAILFQSGGFVNTTTINVRIADKAIAGTISATIDMTSAGASPSSIGVSGIVNPGPLIYTSGSFAPFNTTSGVASAAQTFIVTGTNLIDDISIIVPTGMEVSSDGISFISPGIVLTQSGGTVDTTIVYVRISNSASGIINGSADLTSNGATTATISVSGNVGPLPTINVTGTFSPFSTAQGTASADQVITVSGTDLLGDIIINLPSDIEASSDGGITYSTSLLLSMSSGVVASTNINVRIAATAISGTITGNADVMSFNAVTVSVPISGTVTPAGPTFSVLPLTLNTFTTLPGVPSATQSLTIAGTGLVGSINMNVVPGLEYSVDGGITYAPSPKFNPVGGIVSATMLVRLSSSAPIGCYTNVIAFSSPPAPNQTINVRLAVTGLALTTAALAPFSTTAGTASANQVYFVNASGLTSTVLVTPPVGYEIAIDTNGAIYNATAVLTPLGGILSNKRVAVRLASTAFGGSHVGSILHTTPGITSQVVQVSGSVAINCSSITTFFAGNDTTFCGTSIQLTGGSVTPGFPYQWRIIGGTAVKIAPDTNAVQPYIIFPDAATSVTQQIELSVDPTCPTKRDTIVITKTITGLPSANAGVDFQTAQTNTISIGNSGGGAITWSTSGTGSFVSANSAVTGYTPSAQDLSDGQVELVLNALGTGSCAAYTAEDTVYVTLAGSTFNLSGNLSNTASATSYRILLAHQMNDFWNVVKDSVFTTSTYNFQGLSNGNYRVQAITNDAINIPTYFGNTVSWENSTVLNIANSNLTGKDIAMNSYALHPDTVAKYLSGEGKFAGRILLDLLNKITNLRIATDAADIKPVQGATINIYNSNGNTKLASTTSDADGFYSVSGLTAQSYQIEVEYPGTVLTNTTASNTSQLQPLANDGNPTTPVLKNVEVVKITQSAQNKLGGVTTSIFQPLETEKIQEMILYPNPAKTKALVKITLPDSWTGTTRVIVFDAQGKPVLSDDYTGNAEALLLKTENLLSGLYQISIQNSGRIQLKQLILE
jgi:hypothetical protein